MRISSYTFVAVIFVLTLLSSIIGLARTPDPPDANGSLSGVVKFEGTAPKATRIDMSQDPFCVKAHSMPVTTEDVVVGANGGLANVVIYISDGLGSTHFDPPAQPAVLEQEGCQYKPHVLALQTNQQLDVVNSDETTHNIHPTPENNREWNMTQPHGMPLEQSFARQEVSVPVRCNVHPWMRAYIAVLKNPYFSVSDKNGSFDIKNLPPGTYTITAWQEKLGTQMQKVTVGAGESKTLDFTFKQ